MIPPCRACAARRARTPWPCALDPDQGRDGDVLAVHVDVQVLVDMQLHALRREDLDADLLGARVEIRRVLRPRRRLAHQAGQVGEVDARAVEVRRSRCRPCRGRTRRAARRPARRFRRPRGRRGSSCSGGRFPSACGAFRSEPSAPGPAAARSFAPAPRFRRWTSGAPPGGAAGREYGASCAWP